MTDIDTSGATLMRTFDLRDGGVVELYIWPPVRNDEVDTYDTHDCCYLLTGLGADKVRLARGTDALQVFTLALQLASSYLYTSKAYKAGDLTFGGNRDLGILADSGWQPESGDCEKASLLASGSIQSIVVLPGQRFAATAFSGQWLDSQIRHVQLILDGRSKTGLEGVLKSLKAYQGYYEAVCGRHGFDLSYKGPGAVVAENPAPNEEGKP